MSLKSDVNDLLAEFSHDPLVPMPVTPLTVVPDTAGVVEEFVSEGPQPAGERIGGLLPPKGNEVTLPVFVQPSLSDAIFKPLTRSRKPAVKLSISGNDTLDLDGDGGFDELISRPGGGSIPTLTDGMVVEISGWGYVQTVGQQQTPKGESIVVVGLKLKQFNGLKITGEIYDPEAEE